MRLCLIFALFTMGGLLRAQDMTAACQHPDPTDKAQVFACLSSLRYGHGLGAGGGVVAGRTDASCVGLSHDYLTALTKSGLPRAAALNLLPSCAMLAQALTDLNGQPPYWSGCLNYPGHNDIGHMKACLESFLPIYSPGQSLHTLNGCADATQKYEYALSTATRLDDGRGHMLQRLPPDYAKPDCAAVAEMLGGTGGPCLNYRPDIQHVMTCLGTMAEQFPACVPLRAAYEAKLRQSYGGQFPPGYVAETCAQLAPLTNAAAAKQAALRQEMLRRQAEMRKAAAAGRRDGWGLTLPGSGGLLHSVLFDFLGAPFFAALFFHGALSIAALLYARRQVMTGRWRTFEGTAGALIAGYLFSLPLLGAHAVLLFLGWKLTHWPWAVGALFVVPVSRLALRLMFAFNLVRVPQPRVGPVGEPGFAAPRRPDSGKDGGLSDDWGRPGL